MTSKPHGAPPRMLYSSPSRTQELTALDASPTSLPPRQSIVHGPLATTTVITTIVEEDAKVDKNVGRHHPHGGRITTAPASVRDRDGGSAPRQSPRRLQPRPPQPTQCSQRAGSRAQDTDETDLRDLRQTRSLFLCGRGLLSLRHIQHLPEMLSLRFLSVHMNSIKALESGCLRTLRHLVELDLSANELREIPPGCWEGLGHLERLNLSSNQLTRLGPAAFSALASLQWLALGFNSISDVTGLRSVPASAPLAYVDLCANRIATLGEVMDALTPHRAHLQELRLESPPSPSSMPTAAADGGVSSSSTTGSAPLTDGGGGAVAHWPIQQNPCCLSTGAATQGASGVRERSGGAAGGRGQSGVSGAARSVPAAANYMEELLWYFPRLLVVNGISYGVDPLHFLRQQRQSRELAATEEEASATDATAAVAAASPLSRLRSVDERKRSPSLHRVSGAESPQVGLERLDDDETVSHAFAELLRRPLPHPLPSSSSSSTRSPSSALSESPKTRRRSRHRTSSRRRARSSSKHRSRASASLSPAPRESSPHRHRAAAAPVAAGQIGQDSGWMALPSERAALAMASPIPPQPGEHAPPYSAVALAPQKAPGMIVKNAAAAGAASKREAPLRPRQRPNSAKPRRASLRRHSASNTSSSATSPSSATAPSPAEVSTAVPQYRPRKQQPQAALSSTGAAALHARKLHFEAAAVTSAQEVSRASSATLSTGQLMPSGEKSTELSLLQVSPSPAGVTDSSDVSPPATATCGQREHGDGGSNGGSHPKHGRVATTTADGTASRVAVENCVTLDAPPPLAATSSAAALRWRPKRISRGTWTEWGAETPSSVSLVAKLTAQVEQLQEQLALRATMISDLRRNLDLTRTQYVEGQREAQQRQQQLRCQVSALKDELARRGEEVTILQRTQQAQLNRAVDSVKAEWMRRLEAAEHDSAKAYAEAVAAWERRLARAEEEKLHTQQTVTVKVAQLATLQRQTSAMETEMQAVRDRAVMHQRHWAARAGLLLAEADNRRLLLTAAAASREQLCHSFADGVVRLHAEVLHEADRGREQAEKALQMQLATWRAQVTVYEDAIRHAASEARSTVMGRNDAEHLSPLQAAPTSSALTAALPMSLVTTPSRTLAGETAAQLQPVAPSDRGKRNQAASSPDMQEGNHRDRMSPAAGRAVAEGSALMLTPTIESPCVDLSEHCGHAPAASCGAASNALAQMAGVDANDTLTEYWRGACARVEAQLHRVEAALQVATHTQQSMAAENTRLLSQVEALEAGKKALASLQSTSGAAIQERDNLLRTLHTLRADMERKDAALDALEEEAHAKLNEKRHRIAELEETVEALTTQQTRATELNASIRGELEAAQATVERLQQELADEKERCKALTQQQQAGQVPDLERKQRELFELLATRNAEAHQHQLEKKTLVHTLTIAREQLVRLYESHQHLSSAHASAREEVTRLQTELDAAQRQVRDIQEASRAKQKATFEVLSHLMTNSAL
ncbi:hypothetical protein LSCM1_05290 [Leishmania martiniquensis]|uniref:Leucine-rich repeat protein n=1 Tax=Leishmania martiniquensis TaxID=1580590 RepID=A0A836GKU2_9TRYP|nr:hypothetical protein LSCM1_05290 [Leishmania martiniquensis]